MTRSADWFLIRIGHFSIYLKINLFQRRVTRDTLGFLPQYNDNLLIETPLTFQYPAVANHLEIIAIVPRHLSVNRVFGQLGDRGWRLG